MNFRKKILLGAVSAVCVFTFVAYGNNTSMPKCTDVYEWFREETLNEVLGDDRFKNIDKKHVENLTKNFKFQNVITEETDEVQKKVTCRANVSIDIDTAKDLIYLAGQAQILKDLEFKSGEILTEKNIEEIFVRTAEKNQIKDSMSQAQKEEIRQEARGRAKDFKEFVSQNAGELARNFEENEIKYTAKRTDDGKLMVKELKGYNDE